MAVFVRRFRVRFNGVTYGPGQPGGQIIEGLSDEEEARLIQTSGGTIEKYVYPQRVVMGPPTDESSKTGSGEDEGMEEEVSVPEAEEAKTTEETIINIDPADLIQPGSKAKKKGR
ncbi:MAG: hypothetical protein HPY58_13605 [Firmicutes bacterium]|nr:hypothetical protein [Bacillota bacterium]